MIKKVFQSPVLALGLLCSMLLLDGTGIIRLAILSSIIHEAGHCIVYILQTKKIPPLSFDISGIGLHTENLHQGKIANSILLLAGSITNFLVCLILLYSIEQKATYGKYFFLATNLFAGGYNLLPVGMLDGGRLLRLWLPDKLQGIAFLLQGILACCGILWAILQIMQNKMPLWL